MRSWVFFIFFVFSSQSLIVAKASAPPVFHSVIKAERDKNYYFRFSRSDTNPGALEELREDYQKIAKEKVFGFDDLRTLIKDNNLRTVEELLPLLPKELRESSVLIYESRAPGRPSTSDLYPRVVLFGSGFNFAFHGDESFNSFSVIETADFDFESGTYVYRQIRFDPEGELPPYFSIDNPRTCMACHARGGPVNSSPRVNWDPYFLWHGVYGSNDDDFANRDGLSEFTRPVEEEEVALKAFLENAKTHPHYRHLPNLETRFDLPKTPEMKRSRPNLEMTRLTALQASRRIVAELEREPDYQELKFVLAYLFRVKHFAAKGLFLSIAKEMEAQGLEKYIDDWQGLEALGDLIKKIHSSSSQPRVIQNVLLFDAILQSNLLKDGRGILSWTTMFQPWKKASTDIFATGDIPYINVVWKWFYATDSDFDEVMELKDLRARAKTQLKTYLAKRGMDAKAFDRQWEKSANSKLVTCQDTMKRFLKF